MAEGVLVVMCGGCFSHLACRFDPEKTKEEPIRETLEGRMRHHLWTQMHTSTVPTQWLDPESYALLVASLNGGRA